MTKFILAALLMSFSVSAFASDSQKSRNCADAAAEAALKSIADAGVEAADVVQSSVVNETAADQYLVSIVRYSIGSPVGTVITVNVDVSSCIPQQVSAAQWR